MIRVLFAATENRWDEYRDLLLAACKGAGVSIDLALDHPADQVDYVIYAPNSGLTDFTPFTRAKAVLSLWAGVESIVSNDTLTQPLTRMVEPGLKQGMVEWVTGQVLRHHLGLDATIVNPDHAWKPVYPPLAGDRTVGILGLGELGAASSQALAGLGFRVLGWSRSQKTIPGIDCRAGDDGLRAVLAVSDILVLLLPLTSATENLMDARRLAELPNGAILINPGRGPLIDDTALIAALDAGQIGHATLDVFREEPLPRDHPFWSHPKVTVTPHVASETRAKTAAEVIAENIRRGEAGEPFLHLVDRTSGY